MSAYESRRWDVNSPRQPLPRTERFQKEESGWYFRTRENILVGPYPTAFDAQLSASLLCARLSQMERTEESAHVIQSFVSDHQRQLVLVEKQKNPQSFDQLMVRERLRRQRLQGLVSRIVNELTRPRTFTANRNV